MGALFCLRARIAGRRPFARRVCGLGSWGDDPISRGVAGWRIAPAPPQEIAGMLPLAGASKLRASRPAAAWALRSSRRATAGRGTRWGYSLEAGRLADSSTPPQETAVMLRLDRSIQASGIAPGRAMGPPVKPEGDGGWAESDGLRATGADRAGWLAGGERTGRPPEHAHPPAKPHGPRRCGGPEHSAGLSRSFGAGNATQRTRDLTRGGANGTAAQDRISCARHFAPDLQDILTVAQYGPQEKRAIRPSPKAAAAYPPAYWRTVERNCITEIGFER
jgi:hypothetical protein